MELRILAIGTKMPSWVVEGYEEYAKRIPSYCALKLVEIPAEKRFKHSDIQKLTETEGNKILELIHPSTKVIALHVQGKSWSTEQLATHIKNWHQEACNVDFLIGGPDGLSQRSLKRADLQWSLSNLTLPHPLVRIVLAEQLYRAFTILQGHPYHR